MGPPIERHRQLTPCGCMDYPFSNDFQVLKARLVWLIAIWIDSEFGPWKGAMQHFPSSVGVWLYSSASQSHVVRFVDPTTMDFLVMSKAYNFIWPWFHSFLVITSTDASKDAHQFRSLWQAQEQSGSGPHMGWSSKQQTYGSISATSTNHFYGFWWEVFRLSVYIFLMCCRVYGALGDARLGENQRTRAIWGDALRGYNCYNQHDPQLAYMFGTSDSTTVGW